MIKGVYFPGLRPEVVWTEALSPLLQSLVVYDLLGTESADAPPTPWEARLVAPLGPERARFLALLREMSGREAEFFRGQMLAQASRPGRDRDEATVGNLAGALRLGGGVTEDRERLKAERLWQARLFLQLAELVSVAEQEVSLGLAAVAGRQAAMMKALQGGDEEEEEVEFLPPPAVSRPGWRQAFRSRDQLAAWAVFYLLNPEPEPLLLTADPEAAALLVEGVERLAPDRGLVLPELWLGAGNPEPLAAALVELVQGNLAAGQTAWAAGAAGTAGSAGASGQAAPLRLRLWLLPGAEFHQVMLTLSGLPGDSDGTAPAATPYVLVGVVGPEEF